MSYQLLVLIFAKDNPKIKAKIIWPCSTVKKKWSNIPTITIETRTKMATMAAENVIAAIQCKVPPNLVNRVSLEQWKCKI